MYVSGLGKVDNRICMVLEWSRIDLLCCSVSLHLKGTWETQNHQAFCVSLVLLSFTLIMSIISETLHDQSSQIPSYQILGT